MGIENINKTLEIEDERDVERYTKMERNEDMIHIDTLQNALNIMKAMGCKSAIRLTAFYCLSEKGFLLSDEKKTFGVKF
jgi:hypothetical protein